MWRSDLDDVDSDCSQKMKEEITKLKYEDYNADVVALNTAKSAAAQAWSDAASDGKTDEKANEAAELTFIKFAPKGLFNKARVSALGKALKDGTPTQIKKSEDTRILHHFLET